MRLQPLYGKRMLTAAVLVLGAVLLMPKPAAAITPEDPKVKARVALALKYLSTAVDDRLGGECLIALCFKKAEQDEHPRIAKALAKCQAVDFKNVDNYSLGIGLAFLCEIDPQLHHDLIVKYMDVILARQKSFGGWTYTDAPNGDTSQTQYAVMGMWMAKNYANVPIPSDRVESVCHWLMRTQDVSGGWGYHGNDPGSLIRVQQGTQQSPVSLTLSASGGGSLYMAADLLQVTKRIDVASIPKSKVLLDVEEPGKKGGNPRGPLTKILNPGDIMSYLAAADKHLGTGFTPQDTWNYYYMYALERYHSFRERAGGGNDNRWYDMGFEYLDKNQNGNGSWTGAGGIDQDAVATAFATLFLLRSAKKAIVKKLGEGVAVGGMGLKADVRAISVTDGGKEIDNKIVLNTEQILDEINKGGNEEAQRLADEKEILILSGNKKERDSQLEKLRNFVGAGDYSVRKLAVTSLGKVRDLDNVPKLLYALTDPDPRIVMAADKGLRFISRKVHGVGLPEQEPITVAQMKSAQNAWRAWYLSIRPDAELLD